MSNPGRLYFERLSQSFNQLMPVVVTGRKNFNKSYVKSTKTSTFDDYFAILHFFNISRRFMWDSFPSTIWSDSSNKKMLEHCSYLDVLEMNFRILAEVDDGSKEIEETLIAFVWFEHVNEFLSTKLLVIFRSNLNDNLQFTFIIRNLTIAKFVKNVNG